MNPVLVEVTRGERVESRHCGAVAVVDAHGKRLAAWGDVEAPVFPRSAFKALQALPLIETGAADALGLGEEELALACASHSGQAMHVDRVRTWLEKLGCKDDDLACGPHPPFNESAANAMIAARERPCRVHNNCSGKHTGFLSLASKLDVSVAGYEKPDHPVQVLVREAIAAMCDLNSRTLPVAIDGCAAPNYAIPLAALAKGMARLGDPSALAPGRAEAAQRLLAAWKAHPLLVAGDGRACADLIAAARGRTVVKTGAEGVFTAVLPDRGLGIALKIDDGAGRAAETLMAKLLILLGQADEEEPAIARYLHPEIRNWRGDLVGARRPAPALARLL